MAEAFDTRAAIEEFASKSVLRRRGQLAQQEWPRLDELEDLLRDAIDGAHPAPRRIQGPEASRGRPSVSGPARGPSSAPPAPPAPPAPVRISAKDREKLSEVPATSVGRSAYTPPVRPAYLDDYYSSDLSMDGVFKLGNAAITRAIGANGNDPALTPEAKVFFGLTGGPAPRVTRAERSEERSAPAPRITRSEEPRQSSAPAEPERVGCILHLIEGGHRRGECLPFDPEQGVIVLRAGPGAPDETVSLDEVLAIFFAVGRGVQPREAVGERLVIKLSNDREIIGLSSDYEPGASALTLVPDERRGNVDRIWIPAWSVKAIELG
jgi:hypothetical protein